MIVNRAKVTACAFMFFCVPLAAAGMADHLERKKVSGVDVLVYPTAVKNVVAIMGALPAGESLAVIHHENVAAAKVTAMMLDRGTAHKDKFAIAKQLESIGAGVMFGTHSQALFFQARCLSKDLPLVLKLIVEQLREPALAQVEFEKARTEFIGQIDQEAQGVEYRAQEAFRSVVFPEGDPNHQPTLDEYRRAAKTLSLDEVKAFHHKYYGPSDMTLVLVGDVKMATAESSIASAFKGWTGGTAFIRDQKGTISVAQRAPIAVEIPGKTSAVFVIGQATGVRAQDPDAIPLEVGTAVLGSGFTGRLMHSVRDVEGLTYNIEADVSDDYFTGGGWLIQGTFAPDLLQRGLASTKRELQHWWTEGITEQELAARKTNLIGQRAVMMSNTQNIAYVILFTLLQGRPVQWLDEYPKAIAATSVEKVNQAMRRYLDPQRMVIIEAGTLPKS